MNNKYAKAYREVMEIIKYLPEKEYCRIPKETIDFYEKEMDHNYDFSFDPQKDLSKQNLLKETKAIIIALFQDFFATDEEKKEIDEILNENELRNEQEKSEKYKFDEIFNKNAGKKNIQIDKQETELIKQKEGFFIRLKKFICRLLHNKK
ncbi:MAG: hypothetical protein IJK18_06200 [Clostridia bacterium]|nr:hypothetical protein [Clostridia bacterium]